jgi:nuclear transport factor 2 (NTF2) superfamily protein
MTAGNITPAVARMTRPFTLETARAKVKAAENTWNSRDPEIVAQAYTENSERRNRVEFFKGREAIKAFLKQKWEKELDYCSTRLCAYTARLGTEGAQAVRLMVPDWRPTVIQARVFKCRRSSRF